MSSTTQPIATAATTATTATTIRRFFPTNGSMRHFEWDGKRIDLEFGQRKDWKQLVVYISTDSPAFNRPRRNVLFTSNPANSLPADSWPDNRHPFQFNTMIMNEDTRWLLEDRDLPKFHGYTLVAALSTAHIMTKEMHEYLTTKDLRTRLEGEMEKAVALQKEVDDSALMAKQGREGKQGKESMRKEDDSSSQNTGTFTEPSKTRTTSSISFDGSVSETVVTKQASELSAAETDANRATGRQAW